MKDMINELVNEYETRCPFELAKGLGIHTVYEPLGKINGYFNVILGEKFIHVNVDLDECQQMFTAAHELGHALLHSDINAMFLIEKTHISVQPLEWEANTFAVQLVITDDMVDEYKKFSIPKLSEIFSLHPKLIEYRFKMN